MTKIAAAMRAVPTSVIFLLAIVAGILSIVFLAAGWSWPWLLALVVAAFLAQMAARRE